MFMLCDNVYIYSLNKIGSMEQYLDSIKELVQKLEASGSHINEEELAFHTDLNGLKKGYKSFKQAIRTHLDYMPLTFSNLSTILMAEDLHITQDQDEYSSPILLAQHQTSNLCSSVSFSPSPTGPTQLNGSNPSPPAQILHLSSPAPPPSFQYPFPPPAP
ncbi:hypothetical protein RHSIM_Rhsim12G0093700 [Rhododendron simsii]|uniref:Uncharacterized protein n=1 Tax=Rhododendron simsii TaxID=118357 RepID=A0A834G4D1_RHOSS|nr:hypothetical protein RHSIM_Rhsim12G0093700 [Rhododendron simsii]